MFERIRLAIWNQDSSYISEEDFDTCPQQQDILYVKGQRYRVLFFEWRQNSYHIYVKSCIVKQLEKKKDDNLCRICTS